MTPLSRRPLPITHATLATALGAGCATSSTLANRVPWLIGRASTCRPSARSRSIQSGTGRPCTGGAPRRRPLTTRSTQRPKA